MFIGYFTERPYQDRQSGYFGLAGRDITDLSMSNRSYDPRLGADLYNRYLDEKVYAEAMGFDGLMLNEHHSTPFCMGGVMNVEAAILARITKRARILILGNPLANRRQPTRIAEEMAMIDVISRGRLDCGFIRGVPFELSAQNSNPMRMAERLWEAHDLIVKAWTTHDGPFNWEGRYFHHRQINIWPRPYQQPHPPIWAPSTGSTETIEWAAHPSRKYTYLQAYSPTQSVARYLNYYRECAQRMYGYTASSEQIGWSTPVYISDTDQKARDEAKPHIEIMFNRLLRLPFEMLFPPGYLSAKSLKNMRTHKRSVSGQEHTIDTLIEHGIIACGSPDTVRKQFMDTHRLLGHQNLLCLMQFGTLPRDLTERNLRLFASEVMPALQGLTDKEYGGTEMRAAE
jgi:alkanesulfonate monooxygenase SsuD/methylene tetrahydromethanopterin reductase-like flavin-dependent oxidoreductase (luciferase family)